MEEICIEIDPSHFLAFCAQLTKQGCDVVAVNTFGPKTLVWLSNSPMLQAQFVPVQGGTMCAGFNVSVLTKKPKGKIHTKLHNITYIGLLQHCDANRRTTTSWSAPTSLECPKIVYK
jgi:hypothetical protein